MTFIQFCKSFWIWNLAQAWLQHQTIYVINTERKIKFSIKDLVNAIKFPVSCRFVHFKEIPNGKRFVLYHFHVKFEASSVLLVFFRIGGNLLNRNLNWLLNWIFINILKVPCDCCNCGIYFAIPAYL